VQVDGSSTRVESAYGFSASNWSIIICFPTFAFNFNLRRSMKGSVKKYDPKSDFYKVVYKDGDWEDLEAGGTLTLNPKS